MIRNCPNKPNSTYEQSFKYEMWADFHKTGSCLWSGTFASLGHDDGGGTNENEFDTVDFINIKSSSEVPNVVAKNTVTQNQTFYFFSKKKESEQLFQ